MSSDCRIGQQKLRLRFRLLFSALSTPVRATLTSFVPKLLEPGTMLYPSVPNNESREYSFSVIKSFLFCILYIFISLCIKFLVGRKVLSYLFAEGRCINFYQLIILAQGQSWDAKSTPLQMFLLKYQSVDHQRGKLTNVYIFCFVLFILFF